MDIIYSMLLLYHVIINLWLMEAILIGAIQQQTNDVV